MAIKISHTSKLGVPSWSLRARHTCPGSLNSLGELVDACAGCYAAEENGGNYRFPNVKQPRIENQADWERPGWVADMVERIMNEPYFRWFDSGDMYALKLAWKMYEVMSLTPGTKHWLPTRMHKFPKFRAVIAAMMALPNVVVRPSSDSVLGAYDAGLHGSVIFPAGTAHPRGTALCTAYEREGKCGPCRLCYDKQVKVIAYPTHGRVMTKVVNRRLAEIKVVVAA